MLDTNVVSELMVPAPALAVRAWISKQRLENLVAVSVITMTELLYGIELLPRGKRRDGLTREAEEMFAVDFAGRILVFDQAAARVFGQITASRRGRGRPIATLDAQIAAIARANDATLATRNTADFEGCGVRLLNPWQE